jgi:hypothetical protein
MIAAIEKPLATRTLIAVTSEASQNAFSLRRDPQGSVKQIHH